MLIGSLPIISVALAGFIATVNECPLNEGGVQPCILWGRDIGGLLYTMAVMGWLGLFSIFIVAAGLLGIAWELLLASWRWLQSR